MEEIIIPIQYKDFDLEISAFIHEKGKNWLFCLHGLQSNKNMFTDFLSKPFFEDYSFLVIDFVGFGKSSKPEHFSYDLLDQAKICQEVILSLDLNKIHILGHSLGGMVGTLLVEMIPERIMSLINMEGNFVLEDCGTSKEVENFTFQDFRDKEFQKIKDKLRESHEPSAKYRAAWLCFIPDYAFYKSSLSIVQWSKSRKLLDIFLKSTHKILYVYGDKNTFKITSLGDKVQMAKILNAGHFMLIDNLDSCAQQIHDFLFY